jgi:hypothetical protein
VTISIVALLAIFARNTPGSSSEPAKVLHRRTRPDSRRRPLACSLSRPVSPRTSGTVNMLRHGLVSYGAFYAWIVSAQGETYHWPPMT